MMSRSSNKLAKIMRTSVKLLCFAILFALVFGIVFTGINLTDNTIFSGKNLNTANALVPNHTHNVKNFSEPYTDTNENNQYDVGEPFIDYNENGTRDTNSSTDSIFGGVNFAETFVKNATGTVRPDSDIIDATSFTGFGVNDGTSWTFPATYYNADYTKAVSIYALQETRYSGGGNVQAYDLSNITVANIGNGTDHGFDIKMGAVSGNLNMGASMNIAPTTFIEQLLNDGRYTVQAKVTSTVKYFKNPPNVYTFLHLKYNAKTSPSIFNAKDIDFLNRQPNEVYPEGANHAQKVAKDNVYRQRVFKDNRADDPALGYVNTYPGTSSITDLYNPYDFSLVETYKGKGVDVTSNLTLTKENPYITLSMIFGESNRSDTDTIAALSSLSVTYTVTYNNSITRNQDTVINDGAAPQSIVEKVGDPAQIVVPAISPYAPNGSSSHKDNMYLSDDNAIKGALGYDSVYLGDSENISNNIRLGTYTNKELGKLDTAGNYAQTGYYKSLKLRYQDQYFYDGLLNPIKTEHYSSGIKKVEFSASQDIGGQTKELVFRSGNDTVPGIVTNFSGTSEFYIAREEGNSFITIGKIIVEKIDHNGKPVSDIYVTYKFVENVEIQVFVYDYHKESDSNSVYEQTIQVSGIDLVDPNALTFNSKDQNYLSALTNSIFEFSGAEKADIKNLFNGMKWFNGSLLQMGIDAHDIDDLTSTPYAWYIDIVKAMDMNNLVDTSLDALNIPQKADGVTPLWGGNGTRGVASRKLLKVQGIDLFNEIYFDFTNGDIIVNNQRIPMGIAFEGNGYYAFSIYTIDLTGNIAQQRTTIFIKVDFTATQYSIEKEEEPASPELNEGIIKQSYFENDKVSGHVWSHEAFKIPVVIAPINGSYMTSLSGNYIKFVYNNQEHILAFDRNGIIRFDNQNYNHIKTLTTANSKLDFNISVEPNLINVYEKYVDSDGNNSYTTGEAFNDLNDNGVCDQVEVVGSFVITFDFKINDDLSQIKTINDAIEFFVGTGDGLVSALEYSDPTYKYRKTINSANAQERGIKINIETKNPHDFIIDDLDYLREGLIDQTVYNSLITQNKEDLHKRVWNTTGLLELSLRNVERNSVVYVVVVNKNGMAKGLINHNDFGAAFGSDVGKQKARNINALDLAINNVFKGDAAKDEQIMILSTQDTSTGSVHMSVPLFTNVFGVGLRDIYIFSASESGRISTIYNKSILVDDNIYYINPVIENDGLEKVGQSEIDHWGLKDTDVQFLLGGGKNTFRRGEDINFSFIFNDKSYVPYSLEGRNGVMSTEQELFINDKLALDKTHNPLKFKWNRHWNYNPDIQGLSNSKYVSFVQNKGTQDDEISLRLDSCENLYDNLIPMNSDVKYTLHIRKYIDYGTSGVVFQDQKDEIDTKDIDESKLLPLPNGELRVPLNLNGTKIMFWSSYPDALNYLNISYKDGANPIDKITQSRVDPYKVTARLKDNNYYVSNIEFNDFKFYVDKCKLSLAIYNKVISYGDTPTPSFQFYDMDGTELSLEKIGLTEEEIAKAFSLVDYGTTNQVNEQIMVNVGEYTYVIDFNKLAIANNYSLMILNPNNKFTVEKKVIPISFFGSYDGQKYCRGIERKYLAKEPDLYLYIKEDVFNTNFKENDVKNILPDFAFKGLQQVDGIPGINYYVFKDGHGVIMPNYPNGADKDQKIVIPGNYTYSTDTSKIYVSSNFELNIPIGQYMGVTQRTGLTLTIKPGQTIFTNADNYNALNNIYLGNLDYDVDDNNKDLLNEYGFIDGLKFKLSVVSQPKHEYKVEAIMSDYDGLGNIVCDSNSSNIIVYDMGNYPFDDFSIGNQIVFVNQNEPIQVEYGLLDVGESVINKTNASNFNTALSFFMYRLEGQPGENGAIINPKWSSVAINNYKFSLKVTAGSKVVPSIVSLGNITYVVENSASEQIKNVTSLAPQLKFKVVSKEINVVPVLNAEQDNAFTVEYSKEYNIGYKFVDRNGMEVNGYTYLTGQFDKALFKYDEFIQMGSKYDKVLNDTNYHYGIVVRTPFTVSESYVIVKFDPTMNAYYTKDNATYNKTSKSINAIQITVNPLVVEFNDQSFANKPVGAYVGKIYDGTTKYYNPNYALILGAGFEDFIFDIEYTAPYGTVGVKISNIRVIRNENCYDIKNNRIEGQLPVEFIIPSIVDIIPISEFTLNASDIIVTKPFDGTTTLSTSNIILPDELSNIPFTFVGTETGVGVNEFDSIDVSDKHVIKTLSFKFTGISNAYIHFIEGSGITIEQTDTEATITVNSMNATISKRVITSDDIDLNSIKAIDKVYDGTVYVEYLVSFNQNIKNYIEALRKEGFNVQDDLGMRFIGNTGQNSNAGFDQEVYFENIYKTFNKYNPVGEESVVYNDVIFAYNYQDIASAFTGHTVNVAKGLVKPVLQLDPITYNQKVSVTGMPNIENVEYKNDEPYVGNKPATLPASKDISLMSGTLEVATLTIYDLKLSDESKINANVKNPDNGYKHNVLIYGEIKATLTPEQQENMNNYTLDVQRYFNGKYVYYEEYLNKTISTLVNSGEKILIEVRDAVVVNPINITIKDENIKKPGGKVIDTEKYSKVYDGTNDAKFVYGGSEILTKEGTSEASIEIIAKYDSKDAGSNKTITFKQFNVIPNNEVNPDSKLNYNIISSLQQINNATISPRPLYIDTITLKDTIYNGKKEINETKGYNFTATDMTVTWDNNNGTMVGVESGFIEGDKQFITLEIKNMAYGLQNSVVGGKTYIGNAKKTNDTIVSLVYSKLKGVNNYKIAENDTYKIEGKLLKSIKEVNLLVVDKNSFKNKEYDGSNSYMKILKADFGTYFKNAVDIPSATLVELTFIGTQAGTTDLDFIIKSDDDFIEYKHIGSNTIKKNGGTVVKIEPAIITYTLNETNMPYGQRDLMPNITYSYKSEPIKIVNNVFVWNDGTKINELDASNMPQLPSCIIDPKDPTHYIAKNNGTITDFKFVPAIEDQFGIIVPVNANLYVYAAEGQTKEYGKPMPTIQKLYFVNENGKDGFVGYDNAGTVFGDKLVASYELYNKTDKKWYTDKNAKNDDTDIIVYLLRLKYNGVWIEDNGAETPTAVGHYNILYRYTYNDDDVNNLIVDNYTLKVVAPSTDLRIKDNTSSINPFTTKYDGTNVFDKIISSNKNGINFIYYSYNGTEYVKVDEIKDARSGVYQLKVAINPTSYNLNGTQDNLVFKFKDEDMFLHTTSNNTAYDCYVRINPNNPGITLKSDFAVDFGTELKVSDLDIMLLQNGDQIIDQETYDALVEYLNTNKATSIILSHCLPGTNNYVDKDNLIFDEAGFYKVIVKFTQPNNDSNPLYNFETFEMEVSKPIQLETIKIIVDEVKLLGNLVAVGSDGKLVDITSIVEYVPDKKDYITATSKTTIPGVQYTLSTYYTGGVSSKFTDTIISTGDYRYRIVVLIDGEPSVKYEAVLQKGDDYIKAEGRGLKIAKKVINGAAGSENDVKLEAKDLVEGVENISNVVYTSPNSNPSDWNLFERHVNSLENLATEKSALTAVVRLNAKGVNDKQYKKDIKDVKVTIAKPSNLNDAHSLQIFYVGEDGYLKELDSSKYTVSDKQIVFNGVDFKDGALDLVFVTEHVFIMPAWGIALSTVGGVALLGCIIAIAIVSIKGKKRI